MDTNNITRVIHTSFFFVFASIDLALKSLYCCLLVLSHLFVFSNRYTTGPAELLFNGKPTGLKSLELIFDTGSSYTNFNSKTYLTIVKLVNSRNTKYLKTQRCIYVSHLMNRCFSGCFQIENDLKSTPLKVTKDDKTLPICWKGAKPFKSVLDFKNLFKTITIHYTNGRRDTQLHIPPESYLIISVRGLEKKNSIHHIQNSR